MSLLTHITEIPQIVEKTNILNHIGNTPLIQLRNIIPDNSFVKIFAKAEWFNPGGSVKDRAAFFMISQAIRNGSLTKNKTILDASSGNTGVGYALIAASLGYKITICIPKNASIERIRLLKAYGANLVLTNPLEGMDEAILTAQTMKEEDPDLYYYPNQYNNNANWLAHYLTTGVEIWNQTGGKVTHFVAGLGTSGTFTGVTRRLRCENLSLKAYSVQPASPFHGLEGLKHMASSIVPGIYDPDLADESLTVFTEEAQEMTKKLARKEGLLVGLSSGAAIAASLKVASRIDKGIIVTIFPDNGRLYLSDNFWGENR
ncbi:MAG: PLP-dependent cysteine synthase family protein [Candidatus Hodarchaeales archaeon]|jgi:cysteine synthase B